MDHLVRVKFPQPSSPDGWMTTMGTRIETADGQEVEGITKIVLIGEVNDLWRAEIHCFVQPPDISDLSMFLARRFIPSRWQRFKQWLRFGVHWLPTFKVPT